MNKFKVGDRVKVIKCSFKDICQCLGKTFVVDSLGNTLQGISYWSSLDVPCTHARYWFENELELVKGKGRPAKEKEVMFIATYDVNDVDPHKTFTSKKELTEWLKEAKEDTSIRFSSIKVYAVKKEFKVVTSFRLK